MVKITVGKTVILICGAVLAAITAIVFYNLFHASGGKQVAVLLNGRESWQPCFYTQFDPPFGYNASTVPIKLVINKFPVMETIPPDKAGCHIDFSCYYKGQSSLKITERHKGIAFLIKDFNSADASVSFYARCEDGKIGYLKIGLVGFDSVTGTTFPMKHSTKKVGDRWQRVLHGAHLDKKAKDIVIAIANLRDGHPVWIDAISVRKNIVSPKEIAIERTISALDALNINYEILSGDEIKKRNLGSFNALVIPYYEPQLKEYCTGNDKGLPSYVIYSEPGAKDRPYAGIAKEGEKDEHTEVSTGLYNFPSCGRFQTLDLKDVNLKPLLWQSRQPPRAVSWKYKNVMWNSFKLDDINLIFILGRLVQDLNLIVAPFVFTCDIDDINTPSVPPENLLKITKLMREKKWCSWLGIKPGKYLNYLEPEFIARAEKDIAIKKQLDLERRQIEAIQKNRDVFVSIPHYHGSRDWLSLSEEKQAENYTWKLSKMARYGFRARPDSFGYRYFPCNEFNEVTIKYLTEVGVHIFRVCHDTGGKFENRYYQIGPLSIIPSDCPIAAPMTSINQAGESPASYFSFALQLFANSICHQVAVFLHGDNFHDDTLGFRALADISALVEAGRIVIYGKPFDLRDKYAYPFRILSQTEKNGTILLTFDRELTGQRLLSPRLPLKQVTNEKNEHLVLFDPYVFAGVGRKLKLHFEQNPGEQIPVLRKFSNNAHLRCATYKDGNIAIELEGYGDVEISLTNLRKSTDYLITNKYLGLKDVQEDTPHFTQTTSPEGELDFRIAISSYNSVLIKSVK